MTDDHKDDYADKTDHEVILILETQVQDLMKNLDKTERQNERLTKTQGQISVVRMVFMGVICLIGGMVMMMSLVGGRLKLRSASRKSWLSLNGCC